MPRAASMVTGGEITPGSVPYLSQYGPDELRAIAEEAHALGLRVTGHAHGAQGVADAVAAGFDGIEHATFMTAKGVHHDPDLFNVMAARCVFVSVPVASTAAQPSPPPGSSVAKRFKAILAGLQTMRAAGVAITVSSDAGIAATKPHEVLPPWCSSDRPQRIQHRRRTARSHLRRGRVLRAGEPQGPHRAGLRCRTCSP